MGAREEKESSVGSCDDMKGTKTPEGRASKEKSSPGKALEAESYASKVGTRAEAEVAEKASVSGEISPTEGPPAFLSLPDKLSSFLIQGTTGFEAHIDKCLELAEYLYNIIKNREGYEMVFDGKVRIPVPMIPKSWVSSSSYQFSSLIFFFKSIMYCLGKQDHYQGEAGLMGSLFWAVVKKSNSQNSNSV